MKFSAGVLAASVVVVVRLVAACTDDSTSGGPSVATDAGTTPPAPTPPSDIDAGQHFPAYTGTCTAPANNAGGTVSATGSYGESNVPASMLDLATLRNGFGTDDGDKVRLVFSPELPYGTACGYNASKDFALGVPRLYFKVKAVAGEQDAKDTAIGVEFIAASNAEGQCEPSGNGNNPSTGKITVTAIDASHIAGSFDITTTDFRATDPNGGDFGGVSVHLVGTFDVPRDCGAEIDTNNKGCCAK